MAYNDMLSVGRYYLKYIDNYEKDKVIVKIEKLLDDYKYVFSLDLINRVSELFGNNEKIGQKNKYITRFGIAQKIVNMTFKYLYCYNDYISELDIDYSNCDCPLDSVIINNLSLKYTWSKLTLEQYIECQSKIKQIVKEYKDNEELSLLGNLAYDFKVW